MKIDEITALVKLLEGSSLNFMEITEGESKVLLGKTAEAHSATVYTGAVQGSAGADVPTGTGAIQEPEVAKKVGTPIKCPMVGVFYGGSSPDAEPFVAVGQRVKKGQVLCIVEAMKLMNEILAEAEGEIVEVCAKNGEIVEFGQPLFYLR